MYPFISIIIPTKNEEKNLPLCLKALLVLDYPKDKYEIIVIDNGSTDKTVQIAKNYGAKVFIKPELTIAALRNYGAKVANGSLLAFVDADVILDKSWLKTAIHCLTSDENIGCAGAFPFPPNESGWVAKTWWILQNPISLNSNQEVGWLPSMSMLVKKSAFTVIGGFSPNLITCEDVDFCYRLRNKFKIIYCKDLKAFHLGEPQSLKQLFKKERWRGMSNYEGIKYHGIHIDELPSLLLPLYYLLLILWLIYTVIVRNWEGILLNLTCWFLPPILKSFLSAKKISNYSMLHKMIICYLVYCLARTISAIDCIKNKFNYN